MSTWKIFSHGGANFRWEAAAPISKSEPDDDPTGAPIPPLPSMADLLLQGCSKLIDNGDRGLEKYPMFKTGLGKSVAFKESSIAKALSIFADDDDTSSTVTPPSKVVPTSNGRGFPNSLFQTGSGKMVSISSAGLIRAKTLLGLKHDDEHDNEHQNLEGFQQPRRLPAATNEPYGSQRFSHSEKKEGLQINGVMDVISESRNALAGGELGSENGSTPVHSKMFDSNRKPPQIKFHTAGGRSLSVSSDALKRARSLLGDPELGNFLGEMDQAVPPFTANKEEKCNDASSNKENNFFASFPHQGAIKRKDISKEFTSPLKSSFKRTRFISNSENLRFGSNLIEKFDAVESSTECASVSNVPSPQKALINRTSEKDFASKNSLRSGSGSGAQSNLLGRSFGGPLADISNNIVTSQTNSKQMTTEKRRFGKSSFVSPFKRPRCSEFSPPLNKDVSFVANDNYKCCKTTVSAKYPFRVPRVYMKEYFAVPPSACSTLKCISVKGKQIKPENAYEYSFKDESGLSRIEAEAFYDMLSHSGASMRYISKEWVANHYKWIVWKLACYERHYPSKCAGNFLTSSNILEELKYRYEREVNHGHRSAIKKILEGDASPSTMSVLCVSRIQSNSEPKIDTGLVTPNGTHNSNNAKVELTDGWYSMNAILDVLLSKQLAAGKLFVGQKLRIWGAGLCGWVGPVSPLEASSAISLVLNMNGTFRAHWADRLGFCKGIHTPMAFRCIKSDGGPVPLTLVGVTRIYPVLYRERLKNGGSIVRSERMESRIVQQHNQRCSVLVDHVISEYQRGVNSSNIHNDSQSEGAKILNILETSSEPEVLMADMSPEQLTSFATYKSKLEATRKLEMEKSIEKALMEAGLNDRDVVPFMRVRVVGLTNRNYHGKGRPKEGIITIWNPTEKQASELVEGQAYVVAGLIPMNSDSGILYLQARGSTTKWQPLSPLAMESFEPFFCSRKSTKLSHLGEISLSSEFDIAAYVVHVGEVYKASHQKKQWVFVTDGSISSLQSDKLSDSLLAISFCSPSIDDDSFSPINSNLVGSMVGFCNLIKKPKDQMNHLWVAEATENSAYHLNFSTSVSHLKSAGASVQAWAKASNSIIEELQKKVLYVIGNSGG